MVVVISTQMKGGLSHSNTIHSESAILACLLHTRAWPYKMIHVKQDNDTHFIHWSLYEYTTRRTDMSGNSTLNALEQAVVSQLPSGCVFFHCSYDIIEVDCVSVMLEGTLLSPLQVRKSYHIMKIVNCAG